MLIYGSPPYKFYVSSVVKFRARVTQTKWPETNRLGSLSPYENKILDFGTEFLLCPVFDGCLCWNKICWSTVKEGRVFFKFIYFFGGNGEGQICSKVE